MTAVATDEAGIPRPSARSAATGGVELEHHGNRFLAPIRHSLHLAGRSVIKMRRTPEQFFDVTLQPIIFVWMFVYLFGGAVAGSTHDYLQFILPALMVQNALFSTVSIGVNLSGDIRKGVFDRFRSLPVARSAPLVGAVLAEVVRYALSIVVLLLTGLVMGFRFGTSWYEGLAGCLLVLGFSLCMCWISVFVGMTVRSEGSVQGFSFLVMFPLTFLASTFVPTNTLPEWLQAWVRVNPVDHVVNAARGLMLGGPVQEHLLWSVGWGVAIVAVFAPLAVRAYRRSA